MFKLASKSTQRKCIVFLRAFHVEGKGKDSLTVDKIVGTD